MYRRFFKRWLDLLAGLTGFIVIFPVFCILAFIVALANHGKCFFTQLRPGKNGRIFRIIKFRTMNDRRDDAGNLLPDAARLTKIGKFMRITSLDEIPQLLNVIKGDMSFVGPRPLLVDYLPMYTDQQARRHEVRPGITGWAQVNGRNAISWERKFELDVWYVDNLSFGLDTKIFLRTLRKVVRREGIYHQTSATSEPYDRK